MTTTRSGLDILRALAPGTPLRNAIELILRQETGALIVLGYGRDIEALCTGGFRLDGADFQPARLAELAKMDGAVITDEAAEVIYRANVHLIPDPSFETNETGTRHRTGERVAKETGRAVIVVSEGRQTVTVYTSDASYSLRSPTTLLAQANQNLLTLERFRRRLTAEEQRLTQLEVDDIVVYRDVVQFLQRAALVRRIGEDLDHYAVELGGEGQLIKLQLVDLLSGTSESAELVYSDHVRTHPPDVTNPLNLMKTLSTEHLSDESRVAALLDFGPLEHPTRSRGYRILDRIPRLLDEVEGVGRTRARQLRHYFDRLLDTTRSWAIDDD